MASHTITAPEPVAASSSYSIELDDRTPSSYSKSKLPSITTGDRNSQFANVSRSLSDRGSNGDEENSPMDQPPEGATVFERPNVSEVKGKLFSANFALFLAGLSDGSTGALIPYLEPAYNIGLLFVALMLARGLLD